MQSVLPDATLPLFNNAAIRHRGFICGRCQWVPLQETIQKTNLFCDDVSFTAKEAEEHVSLSDRFGLHLGFYGCDQETYLAMIDAYATTAYALPTPRPLLQAEALEWAG